MRTARTFLVPSGYNFRAVLAFCRALRRAGVSPAIVACTDEDPVFKTAFRDCVVHTRPTRVLGVADFATAVQAARAQLHVERCVLAPSSEFLVRWALQHRSALESVGCDLPLPDERTYSLVTEKSSFTDFCRNRGLCVPGELGRVDPASLPAVAKPRWNVSPDGRSLYPWLLKSVADLEAFAATEVAEHFFYQQWVDGRSLYLLFYISGTGRVRMYSQENLLQQPGGKSIVLARGSDAHQTAAALCWRDALLAAGFTGLAMIELRQHAGGYVFIEANPRLWGPLQLTLDGCPGLLMEYIAEHTGIVVPAGAAQESPRPYYVWTNGLIAGRPAAHGIREPLGRAMLIRHLGSDVYLRPDSWRYFFAERQALRPALGGGSNAPARVQPRVG